MNKARLNFLTSVLNNLNETTKLQIINEHRYYQSKTQIYLNEEDEIENMLDGYSHLEVMRMVHYGSYNFTDAYAYINAYGNLSSACSLEEFTYIPEVAKWMIDSSDAYDAWKILEASSYVETGEFEDDFVDEFESVTNADYDDIREWFESENPTIEYIFTTSWEVLYGEFTIWKERKEEELEKTMERCRGENY